MAKSDLIVILGGIILTLTLLLPRWLSFPCPLRPNLKPSWQERCPFFVDQNQNAVCDILENIPSQAVRPKEFNFSFLREFLLFTLLLAAAVFVNFKKPKNLPVLRLSFLAFSLFYFGFLLHQSLCPVATLQMVFVQRERVVLLLFIFLVFLLPLIVTLLWGAIFCHFLCPVGAVQEIIFKASRKFAKTPVLTHFPRSLFFLPFIILFLVAFSSTRFLTATFCKIDPFGVLYGCNPTGWKLPFLIVLLIASFFIFRPFCQFLCPLGAIFKFLEKFRILKPTPQSSTNRKSTHLLG